VTESTLNIEINSDRASRDLKELDKGLGRVERSGDRAADSVEDVGERANKSRGSFLGLGAAVAAVFTTGALVQFTSVIARFESLENSLNVVFGSAERGRAVFEDINELAGITPFSVDALTESVIKLRAAGIEPSTAQLTLFSDVASVTTDRVGSLQAITDLFARTTAGGLGLEDLNRLMDRGIPVFTIFKEKLGLAREEISGVGKSTEGAALLLEALTEGLEERFGGASAAAANTLEVSISNLGIAFDNFLLAIGRAGALDFLTSAVQGVTSALEFMGDNLDTVAVAAGGLATLIIPKLISSIKLLTLAIAANPIGFFIVALTTAATVAFQFRGAIFDFLIKTFEVSIPNAIDFALIGLLKFSRAVREVVNVVLRQINRLGNTLISSTPDFLKDLLGISGEPFQLNLDVSRIDRQIDAVFERIRERTENFVPPPRPDFLGLDDDTDKSAPKPTTGLSDSGSLTGDRTAAQQDSATEVILNKERDRAARKLEIVENSLLTEEERLRDSFFNRQFIVEEAFENELIGEEKRQELLLGLAQQYEEARTEIERQGWNERQRFAALSATNQTKQVVGEMINMTAGVARENKRLFELNKAAGIANAIINAWQGASRTMAEYPYPLNAALAAISLATGLAQVRQISKQSFSGGGGASGAPSGVGGGAGATNADTITPINVRGDEAPESGGRKVEIIIQGNVFANDDFRASIVEALEVAEDNDEVILRAS
jgi:hypothetical protein